MLSFPAFGIHLVEQQPARGAVRQLTRKTAPGCFIHSWARQSNTVTCGVAQGRMEVHLCIFSKNSLKDIMRQGVESPCHVHAATALDRVCQQYIGHESSQTVQGQDDRPMLIYYPQCSLAKFVHIRQVYRTTCLVQLPRVAATLNIHTSKHLKHGLGNR